MSQSQGSGSGKWNQLTEELVERIVRENGAPLQLQLPPVGFVDLNTGSTGLLTPGVSSDDESACLLAWMNAQSEFVSLPVLGGRIIEGFRMTGRTLGSQDESRYATPGANLLVIESPNGVWAMAVGFARREPDGADLWRVVLGIAGKTASELKCPPVPWVAWSVSAADGVSGMPRVLPEIATVVSATVTSLFRYYATIDYINADNIRERN